MNCNKSNTFMTIMTKNTTWEESNNSKDTATFFEPATT